MIVCLGCVRRKNLTFEYLVSPTVVLVGLLDSWTRRTVLILGTSGVGLLADSANQPRDLAGAGGSRPEVGAGPDAALPHLDDDGRLRAARTRKPGARCGEDDGHGDGETGGPTRAVEEQGHQLICGT